MSKAIGKFATVLPDAARACRVFTRVVLSLGTNVNVERPSESVSWGWDVGNPARPAAPSKPVTVHSTGTPATAGEISAWIVMGSVEINEWCTLVTVGV